MGRLNSDYFRGLKNLKASVSHITTIKLLPLVSCTSPKDPCGIVMYCQNIACFSLTENFASSILTKTALHSD